MSIEHLHSAIKYCEETQTVVILGSAYATLGIGYGYRGEKEVAREYIEKGIELSLARGGSLGLSIAYLYLGRLHFELGEFSDARNFSEKSLELAKKHHGEFYEGAALLLLGGAMGMVENPQYSEAEECILRGMKLLEGLKGRPNYTHGWLFLGRLYANMGQKEKAMETLKKAEAAYQEMGMDYWLRRTQEVLERVEGK